MLEYFAYKQYKKLREARRQELLLKPEDEVFLEKVVSQDEFGAIQSSTSIKPSPGSATQTLAKNTDKKSWSSYLSTNSALTSFQNLPSSIPIWPHKAVKLSSAEKSTDQDVSVTKWERHDKPSVHNDLPQGVVITEYKSQQSRPPPSPTLPAGVQDDTTEVTSLLDTLDLSSVNNRVFSLSHESQVIYEAFLLVLKDMINGVPSAYKDMELLIRKNETQLGKLFDNMPPFVKLFIRSLPSKLSAMLGPEILTAAAATASTSAAAATQGINTEPGKQQKKSRMRLPSLKDFVMKKGAVAALLRSIVSFLKMRFPAFLLGTNVIISLAVFILLFVFYYCYKRGKEVRLAKQGDSKGESEDDEDMIALEESENLPSAEVIEDVEKRLLAFEAEPEGKK